MSTNRPNYDGMPYMTEGAREHFEHVDKLLERLERQLVRRWLIAIVGLFIAAGGLYYAVHQANTAASSARATAAALVQQRRATILENCQEQNARNASTTAFFKGYVKQFESAHHLTAAQKASLGTQVRADLTLINDLAPYQNCQQLVAHQAPVPGKHS